MDKKLMPVSCPACLTEQTFKIFPLLDVEKDSDVKESIFNRNIFRFRCPECGEEILVAYSCTYIDRKNNFMVALVTEENTPVIESADCSLRVTRSINEFVEKIALMEDGIDDRVAEIYKIMLEDQFEEERSGSEILGIYYGGQDFASKCLVFYIITGNAENVRASLSFDVYETICKQFENNPEMAKNNSEVNRDWALSALETGFSNIEN